MFGRVLFPSSVSVRRLTTDRVCCRKHGVTVKYFLQSFHHANLHVVSYRSRMCSTVFGTTNGFPCTEPLTHEGNKLAHLNGSQCSIMHETCTVCFFPLMKLVMVYPKRFALKTVDTIGKCQRPVSSLGVSQHTSNNKPVQT